MLHATNKDYKMPTNKKAVPLFLFFEGQWDICIHPVNFHTTNLFKQYLK